MSSNKKPEWFDWIQRNIPFNSKDVHFKDGTPEEIIDKYYDYKKEKIINSSEKRAFFRKCVIKEIERIFKDGFEIPQENVILTSTAIINLIENYDINGELISIYKIKDKRKTLEKELLFKFDINFDFRENVKDFDINNSETLRKYHQLLWRKMLPNKKKYFCVHALIENVYLFCFISNNEKYHLSSNSIIQTYSDWEETKTLIKKINYEKFAEFQNIGNTIGSFIIFPSNNIDNLPTISQERFANIRICDRFDLTLECIKRFYDKIDNPLYETLKRYENYFELFTDFKGYCTFFFLNDLTLDNFSRINFFLPFNDFYALPIPKTTKEYNIYKKNVIKFYKCRNNRIKKYYENLR